MTEVRFYQLQRTALEAALPRMLGKVLERGARAVVMAGSEERVEALNALLWTYDAGAWLPHGSVRDGNAARQPVWLTDKDENPNGATYLFLTDGAASARIGEYERVSELFDGRDEGAVAAARERWKTYKAAGFDLTYWQQTDKGAWERKG
ncbi:MAG: DNA polymerase III subunit chi [Proteobacteria bacterium]|nr:DNA polymerase III subunit chi [Pseudomonadota bacterium]